MHRIDTDGNVSGLFSDGTPGVAPATVVDASWLTDVQEEICNVITAAGITLVKGTQNQLRTALATPSEGSYTSPHSGNVDTNDFVEKRLDGLVTGHISLTLTGAVATNGTLVTLAQGFCPKTYFSVAAYRKSGTTYSTFPVIIAANGVAVTANDLLSGDFIRIDFTFAAP